MHACMMMVFSCGWVCYLQLLTVSTACSYTNAQYLFGRLSKSCATREAFVCVSIITNVCWSAMVALIPHVAYTARYSKKCSREYQ